jgi:hypothetical protein
MLRAGAARTALVVGFDKHPPRAFDPRPEDWGLGAWYGATGLMLTTQFFAMKIQRYMAEYSISQAALAGLPPGRFATDRSTPTPGGANRCRRRRSWRHRWSVTR